MRPSLRSAASRRGYTVVEVLSAMTLFAIGTAGVVGMLRVSIQGGIDARSFDVATNIAREWQQRLDRDAYINWTAPNALTSASNRDANTVWLKNAVIGGGWKVPAAQAPYMGNATTFDILGRDLETSTDPSRVYCVQYRLSWVAPDASLIAPSTPTAILRAEVRVFWSRLEYAAADCTDTAAEAAATAKTLHFVYVASAIRGNPPLL